MRNILVLTPVYPADDMLKENTPVVHYFTKEWVKLGCNVVVMHYAVNFPKLVYMLAKPFTQFLESYSGVNIRMFAASYREYELDGVKVCRSPLTKYLPHTRYSLKQIDLAYNRTLHYCSKIEFKPDVIVSHWINPCFELMHRLKDYFSVPTAYVAHDKGTDFYGIYKNESQDYINETDVLGYRSKPIKIAFEKKFHCENKPNFMCYSGIPEQYISSVGSIQRDFSKISNFIFVGSFLQRKHPAEIVPAVSQVYGKDAFHISFVGSGQEQSKIIHCAQKLGCSDKVQLLGRLKREKVIECLKRSDVFIMISEAETFGLVYLEAMATGCITIASKNEGFDGIIENGKNGFLCEAGNVEELSKIIKRIRSMSVEDLQGISMNAIKTAAQMTDKNVAKRYLEMLKKIV